MILSAMLCVGGATQMRSVALPYHSIDVINILVGKEFYILCFYQASTGGVATQFIVCSMGIGDSPQQADLPKIP